MRKMLLCLVLVMGLLFSPLPGHAGEPSTGSGAKTIPPTQGWSYHVVFAHFANSSPWWTGLAVCNIGDTANQFIVRVCDNTGSYAPGTFDLMGGAQISGLLDSFVTPGSVPTTGYIWISGTQDFFATKFTGDASLGGFSEIQQDAEYVTPLP